MNRKLLRLQIFACGTLGAGLIGEWAVSRYAAQQLEQQLAAREQVAFEAEQLPTIAATPASVDSYNDIVERPIFIEGRRPIAEAKTNDAGQNSDTSQIDDWSLIGVYDKGGKLVALFSKRNEARKFLKIGEEQSISGWQLKQILADRVILQQAGQEKPVLLRKPRPQLKPAPGKPVPRPAPAPANVNARPIEPAPNEIPETLNDN
ncbi:hypothetical protein [Methylomonas koyamae]|uniref:hypothetical protein n=1 Tax=Methylomonas koyamae TaxID=702114 RepID=UPI001C3206D1|nr:hypothetical protein [Methylomonas koyamae]BBL58697.1 hypothetical protein MKFW12EY_23100 [Methylomonas koyamae]